MSGLFPGIPLVGPGNPVSQVPASGLIPMDVALAGGEAPQTVLATAFQVAAHAAALAANTATSTAGAATLNTVEGLVTTESLSTAVNATYSFVLTNSLIVNSASPVPQVAMYSKSNTGGAITLTSVTNGTGSSTFVFTNTGTSALNGTMLIAFHI